MPLYDPHRKPRRRPYKNYCWHVEANFGAEVSLGKVQGGAPC